MSIHQTYSGVNFEPSTMADFLQYRAQHEPERIAYRFLIDGETQESTLTYSEMDRLARAIAMTLRERGLKEGDRALLLYSPGLDYIAAIFGCIYAGVVAVPAYPPRNYRNISRIQSIVADAQASVALTMAATLPSTQSLLSQSDSLSTLRWLSTDDIEAANGDAWRPPITDGSSLAFLQYTSGSTGNPKGVMLSHSNLIHNSALLAHAFSSSSETVGVTWLPPYHDMGLIGQIIDPLYLGIPITMMSPVAFLQRPYRWLQAVSRYKATTSGAPNFAYELCARKVTEEQRAMLDLSHWKVAFNGAEPIRADTLDRFAKAFEPCGFRREAFYPCYGLAEATLIVSSGVGGFLPVTKKVSAFALEQNLAVECTDTSDERVVVGCGKTLLDQHIVIANPTTLVRCKPDEIGEILVSGPSVAQGYWNRPEETELTLRAYLSDTGEGPFLRTGDLGFLQDGELFITGRIKDLIVICGRNLYPQDIELTAERSHPSLRPGCNAAFSITVAAEERLVIVQEIEFRQEPNIIEVTNAIRQAVVEEYSVPIHAVALIKPGTISKTSSGKIQRHACKSIYMSGSLQLYAPRRESALRAADCLSVGHSTIESPASDTSFTNG